ncbi:hypothetical protein ACU8V6_00125 [Vibrio alginolyticus]
MWPDEYYISKKRPLGFYKNGASDASVNFGVFADPEYDALVDEGYAATDDVERAAITIELQKRWVEHAVWIPVVATPSTLIMSNDVTGVPASAAFICYPWAVTSAARRGSRGGARVPQARRHGLHAGDRLLHHLRCDVRRAG